MKLLSKQDSPPVWPQEAYCPCLHLVMSENYEKKKKDWKKKQIEKKKIEKFFFFKLKKKLKKFDGKIKLKKKIWAPPPTGKKIKE